MPSVLEQWAVGVGAVSVVGVVAEVAGGVGYWISGGRPW